MKQGVEQPAYIINNLDNDLSYHLDYYGDAYTSYEEYKDEDEAIDRMNEYNKNIGE